MADTDVDMCKRQIVGILVKGCTDASVSRKLRRRFTYGVNEDILMSHMYLSAENPVFVIN